MSAISHDTYERIGTGIQYFNLNLGHHVDEVEALPSLNPFQGLDLDDIDEVVIEDLGSRLKRAEEELRSQDTSELAEELGVPEQNVELALEGVEIARSALQRAERELF